MVCDFLRSARRQRAAPVEFVFPEERRLGDFRAGGDPGFHPGRRCAKAFVDFLISKEKARNLALSQGYLPAHPDVAVPEGFGPLDDQGDAVRRRKALAEAEANTARFAEIFGQ